LTDINPRGAERGKTIELLVTGANLTPRSRLVLPFAASQTALPDAKPNPARVRIRLTVDPAVPLGIYPVRLVTDDGVSPFYLFSVDAFPNVNEVEDNSTFDRAQKVAIPVIITGQCPGGDVDYFRFTARKGQKLIVETEAARLGSGIVPQIRVTDSAQRFIAADDSQSVRGDCRLSFTVPADDDYVVEISDTRYRGGNPPHYRLKIGAYDTAEEVFPSGGRLGDTVDFTLRGGTLASPVHVRRRLERSGIIRLPLDGIVRAGMLSPPIVVGELPERLWIKAGARDPKALDILPPLTINSRLEHKGDIDRFQFPVKPGQRFRIAVQAEAVGSYLDAVLRVTDQAGNQLALVDDVAVPLTAAGQPALLTADPTADVVVPANATLVIIELRDQRYRGGMNFVYRLTVEPAPLDFTVQLSSTELNVPRGGSAAMTVPITRRGYQGPIQLGLGQLPPGLSVRGGHVPAGAAAGLITVSSDDKEPAGSDPFAFLGGLTAFGIGSKLPLFVSVVGAAKADAAEIRRRGHDRVLLSRDAGGVASLLDFDELALGATSPELFAVQGPPAIDVVKGYSVTVPIQVNRLKNKAVASVEVTGLLPFLPTAAGQPPPANAITFKPGTAGPSVASTLLTVNADVNANEGLLDFAPQGKAKIANADRTVTGPAVTLNVRRPFTATLPVANLVLPAGRTVTLKGRIERQPVFKGAVQVKVDGSPAGVTLAAPLKPVPSAAGEFQIDFRVDAKAAAAQATVAITCSSTVGGKLLNIGGKLFTHPPLSLPVTVVAKK
jgi:hypothetical protein